MTYFGDFALGKTFDIKFATVNTTGAPTTLAATPVISAYPDNSTTELTAGITLTVDFDARTGMHNVRVVATSGNGYATATNYALVITTGTVGGTSVVGYVIGSFSIEARSAIRPATADRTLVVDAAGLADANAVKVGPTGSGTAQTAGDIPALITTVDDFIDTEVAAIKAKTDNLPASPAAVGSAMTLSDGAITAAKFAAAALVAASFASDYLAAVNAEVDTALATAIPDSYSADGAQPTANQALLEIRQQLQEQAISGTTGTVKKPNGTTTALTLTYNDATNPTSVTRAT